MASIKALVTKYKIPIICLVLFFVTASLRFPSLGYSDYHGDEFKAFVMLGDNQSFWQFLVSQRKGPMQYFVSYLPYIFTHDFRNEFTQRLPFAFISCLSCVTFFLFVQKFSKKLSVSVPASFIFLTCGYLAGFGRIAQYQNLNLFFSFLALLMYTYFSEAGGNQRKMLIFSTLGTLFWCLSLLSHWDAVLISPIVIWIVSKSFRYNVKLLLLNILIGGLIVAPFAIPYLLNFQSNDYNQGYLNRRVGIDFGYSKVPLYLELTKLYSPYIFIPLLLALSIVSLLRYKQVYPIVIWFSLVFILFEALVKSPGTHIYNFLLPLFILSGFGISFLLNMRYIKVLTIPLAIAVGVFLYFQTYFLFVDHSVEYPFQSKSVRLFKWNLSFYGVEDPKPLYMRGSYLPLFGFPHQRYWREINNFINQQNKQNNENLKYITNEDKAFCENYLDSSYGMGNSYYAIGIKRPTNFVKDFSFSNIGSKTTVYKITTNDETVVRVYRVNAKSYSQK